MIYQMVVSIVYTQIFGTQQTSPNTERLIVIARKIPLFIFFVSIVGPLLEEYVFRKVIFGELFNAIKGNRIVAFAIATTVSSLIFALAHNDYKFIPIYFGMGVIFSLAYVWTKRLAVPIIIHMLQNGFVVIFQLLNPEALKKPRNKRILYITFLFHNIKTNHTRIIVAVIRFIFLLFRFTNKNSMIENTTIIEHTIASQLLLYAVDALFLLSSCFNYCKIVFFMRLK